MNFQALTGWRLSVSLWDPCTRLPRVGTKGQTGDSDPLPRLAHAIVAAAGRAGIGVVVCASTPEGLRFARVSSVAEEFFGAREAELVETDPRDYLAPGEAARVASWRAARARSEAVPFVLDVTLRRADGTVAPVRLSSSAIRLGKHDAYVDFYTDASTELGERAALERSELRFRQLIEAAPEAIGIGLKDQIAYANPAMGRLLGYETGRELEQTPFYAHLHPDDVEATRDRLQRLFSGNDWGPPLPVRARRGDGKEAEVEFLGMSVRWDDQSAALVIGRDLGERRALQAQLIQADRFNAVGTLAAGVAHEINNPLAYVLLNLEYLLREAPKFDGQPSTLERLQERLDEVRHGAARVRAIVEELRTFSEQDTDLRTPVVLEQVVRAAVRVCAREVEGRARLTLDLEEGALVLGNAARLEQVLQNLLLNAAHAVEPMGEIRVKLENVNQHAHLEVSDNGQGIAPEHVNRVFDPFFTTKPAGVGTGLGLPICHSIVKSHGGEITVHSEPQSGTTFRIVLPTITRIAQAKTVVPEPKPRPSSRRARVLIVDDEPAVATMLSRVLEEEHDVTVETTAREALNRLLEEEFDVVLCDLLMPSMSGMELYRELAARRPGMEDRIVFMTGGAFTQRAADFLSQLNNPQLEKPFDLERVLEVVHRALAE